MKITKTNQYQENEWVIYSFDQRDAWFGTGIKIVSVFEENDDYLDQESRDYCDQILPNVLDLQPKDAAEAYIHLKGCFEEMEISL